MNTVHNDDFVDYRGGSYEPLLFYILGIALWAYNIYLFIQDRTLGTAKLIFLGLGAALCLNGWLLSRNRLRISTDLARFQWIDRRGKKHAWSRDQMADIYVLTRSVNFITEKNLQVDLLDGRSLVLTGFSGASFDKVRDILTNRATGNR